VIIKKGPVEKSYLLSEVVRVQLRKSSFEGVVKNWVEFWRWQSKVTEKTSCVI
jgi:hypothetical protein